MFRQIYTGGAGCAKAHIKKKPNDVYQSLVLHLHRQEDANNFSPRLAGFLMYARRCIIVHITSNMDKAMKRKVIHCNSQVTGNVSTKRLFSGRVNNQAVYTEFTVIEGVTHMIRDSVMNRGLYTAKAFDELAKELMASNARIPAPLSHPSDENGNFISANDPLIMSAHNVFAFDSDWRLVGDKLVSNTYIDMKRAAENENAAWLIERINNRQPIDRSTGLELYIVEENGIGPDGEEYDWHVESVANLDHSAILNPESEPGAKNNGDGVGMFTNSNGESAVEVAELHVNASNPNLNLPMATSDTKWDGDSAIQRIREYTGSTESPTSNYRRFFMYFDASSVDDFGAYKLPFADIIDGRPHAVPSALSAIDGALSGARGGVDIPEEDKQRIARNVEHYKSKMEKTMPNSKLAQFLNWLGNKFGVNAEMEYNRFVVNNIEYNEVDPMKEKILAALNAAGVKTKGLDDDALFAAYNESMKPKAKAKCEDDMEDMDNAGGNGKTKEKNSEVLEAINALNAKIDKLEAANAAKAQEEIDAVAAQVANAGIMELEDAKKLSVKSLNGLLAKSGVVVANGAGGFSQAPKFEPMPE